MRLGPLELGMLLRSCGVATCFVLGACVIKVFKSARCRAVMVVALPLRQGLWDTRTRRCMLCLHCAFAGLHWCMWQAGAVHHT